MKKKKLNGIKADVRRSQMKYIIQISGEYNGEIYDMDKIEIEKSIWELLNKGDSIYLMDRGKEVEAKVDYRWINIIDNEAILSCDC